MLQQLIDKVLCLYFKLAKESIDEPDIQESADIDVKSFSATFLATSCVPLNFNRRLAQKISQYISDFYFLKGGHFNNIFEYVNIN